MGKERRISKSKRVRIEEVITKRFYTKIKTRFSSIITFKATQFSCNEQKQLPTNPPNLMTNEWNNTRHHDQRKCFRQGVCDLFTVNIPHNEREEKKNNTEEK